MSSLVGSPTSSIGTNKWELAKRLERNCTLPEDTLKRYFDGIVEVLERSSSTKFEDSLKERVRETFSRKRLESIKNVYLSAVCDHVLQGVSEDRASEALARNECDYTYKILSPGQTPPSMVASISILEYFASNNDALTLEIRSAFEQEGIKFSTP